MITVNKRVMVIPKIEKYIGTVGDSNAESRVFRISRYSETQADLSALTFKLVTRDENQNRPENIIYLEKEIGKTHIDLIWTIIENDISISGTLLAQIKGFDEGGIVRWHSFPAAFYVTENLDNPDMTERLSDYEVLVNRIARIKDEITDGMIDHTMFDAEGYLNIIYKDGHIERWYVKGDPPSEEDIIAAASSVGTNIQGLIEEVTTLASQISSSIERAENAAQQAEAAARGEKVSGSVTFSNDLWGPDAPFEQSISTTVFAGKNTSDFVASIVYGSHPVEEKKAYGYIDKIEVMENGDVKATCFQKKPGETITVYLREV